MPKAGRRESGGALGIFWTQFHLKGADSDFELIQVAGENGWPYVRPHCSRARVARAKTRLGSSRRSAGTLPALLRLGPLCCGGYLPSRTPLLLLFEFEFVLPL